MNWSGGKDSAHALWRALNAGEFDVVALLTTINRETRLSTMHNIPMELLEEQSRSIGIPLDVVELRPKGDMDSYSAAMERVARKYLEAGVTHFIFGDIFLHDVRRYRERELEPLGIEVVEPLWGPSSREIIEAYLDSGFQTVVVTTENGGLGSEAIGRIIDRDFIGGLPDACDPNGENGEYHTFCFDGPIFKYPVPFKLGEPVTKSYDINLDDGTTRTFTYCFADLQA